MTRLVIVRILVGWKLELGLCYSACEGFIFGPATAPFLIAHILAPGLGRLGELFPDTSGVSLNPASYAVCVSLSPFFGRIIPDLEASMCAIKNGDEIRCDFPSHSCLIVIYFLEKMSRFGSIRALVVPLLVVNRALYPARTSLRALLRRWMQSFSSDTSRHCSNPCRVEA